MLPQAVVKPRNQKVLDEYFGLSQLRAFAVLLLADLAIYVGSLWHS
jgi:hypothetical protein